MNKDYLSRKFYQARPGLNQYISVLIKTDRGVRKEKVHAFGFHRIWKEGRTIEIDDELTGDLFIYMLYSEDFDEVLVRLLTESDTPAKTLEKLVGVISRYLAENISTPILQKLCESTYKLSDNESVLGVWNNVPQVSDFIPILKLQNTILRMLESGRITVAKLSGIYAPSQIVDRNIQKVTMLGPWKQDILGVFT